MNPLTACSLKLLLALVVGSTAGTAAAHPGNHQKLAFINQQLTASPDTGRWYLQRAKLLLEDSQYEAALDDIDRAEQLGEIVNASLLKGQVFSKQGRANAAISAFDRFLQVSPADVLALQGRAEASQLAGDLQSARRDYQQLLATTLYPSPGLYLTLAKLTVLTGDRNGALTVIDVAIRKLGLTPPLQQYAIQLEMAASHWDAALQRLNQLLPMMQNNPAWYLQQANLLLHLQRQEAALEALHKAGQLLAAQRPTPHQRALQLSVAQLRERL